jgi:nucleotide-binding universal stress UspA family protein
MTADDVFQACLFRSGRPCLVLPRAMATPDFGSRILIGWKDTREAARAVHDAIPFLERADSIEIAGFFEPGDSTLADSTSRDRLADYLRARGLRVTRTGLLPVQGNAARTLLRHVEAERHDMIVMGGFGHSRLSEFLFGGMTRAVVNAMPAPILMAH